MQEVEITVTVMKTVLGSEADCFDLLKWSQGVPGISVAVVANDEGTIRMQLEGFAVPTVYAGIGDTVIWDEAQRRFTVEGR